MRVRRLFSRRVGDDQLAELLSATSVARAEVDRFEERLFVTSGWVGAWGAAVPEGAGAGVIGALVKQGLDVARRNPSPVLMDAEGLRREPEREKGWERFCREVVGVPVEQYQPEIRIDVLDLNDGDLRVRPLVRGARPDEEAGLTLSADADATAVGEAVSRLLAATPPEWPTLRHATLASEANGRLVLYPHHGVYLAGPVRVVAPDVDAATLGVAIRAALDESRQAEGSPGAFDRALQAAGLEERDLAGGAQTGIRETTRGAIVIDAWRPTGGGWEPADLPESVIEAGDLEAAANMARTLLDQIPTGHRKPGVKTGTPFGYKTAWLSARTEHSAGVVDALRLTNTRQLAWDVGIEASYDAGVFVAPATLGWVLAVGVGLFERQPDVAALSSLLGAEVQFFATHRVVERHSWELARAGRLIRRVSYVGESGTFEETGEPTEVERTLGLVGLTEEKAGDLISEETVMQVAGDWSLDPQELATIPTSDPTGLHGQLPSA